MATTMPARAASRHPVLPDIARPVMAKANVRIPDIDWMSRVGTAVSVAIRAAGWSSKEAAAKVGVDDAEFGKWLSGNRRPQLDRLFAVPELRQPLIVALAALAEDIEIVTEIRIRKAVSA